MSSPEPDTREIFAEAIRLLGADRTAYLDRVCAGDPLLRRDVESLLAAHEKAGDFLDHTLRLSEPDVALERPGTMIGRYKLLEKIGEGGFGVVYMAEQTEPVQRKVALKIIKPGMDTRAVVARFEAERQALALMDHPNIAKVLDGGATEKGRPYFVMELVRGIPITDYCDQKSLSPAERLHLFIRVCHAVQHAHQKGIVHRDLKPGNVLVTPHDADLSGVPKVIDFGVAKALGQKLTEKTLFTGFAQMLGTPAYMSPEQAEGGALDIDTRSDVYSLGVLLYELLTGVTPFDQETLAKAAFDEIRRILRETEPQKPSTRLQTLGNKLGEVAKHRHAEAAALTRLVRGDLDWIVMKCLEKDRGRRYETADGLATDLERHLNGEPVVARPASNLYRFGKLVRRNKLAFGAAGAVAAALLVGLGVSTWQFDQKNRAYRRAVAAEREQTRLLQLAQASEAEARRSLYVARIRSVAEAWENNDMLRMRELLDQTRSYSGRGFEWRFWHRKTECKRLRGDGDLIESVAFAPAGDRVMGFGLAYEAYVWEWPSGRALFRLGGMSASEGVLPLPIALSPDGNRLAIGSSSHRARICDAFTGQDLFMLIGHPSFVVSLAFSPDGTRIATGGDDNTARIWDASTGKALRTLELPTNRVPQPPPQSSNTNEPPRPVGVRLVAPGTSAYIARTGDTVMPGDPFAYYVGVAFSPDSRTLATSSSDGSTILWDPVTGARVATLEAGAVGNPTTLEFLDNGRRLLTARADNAPSVWDLPGGSLAFRLEFRTQSVTRVAVSLDRQYVVTAIDRAATLWDGSSGAVLRKFEDHPEKILSVAVSRTGQRIVTAGRTAKLWDVASGREIAWLKGNPGLIRAAAFSPDDNWLLTGDDRYVRVWRNPNKPDFVTWKVEGKVASAAFSPAGTRMAISQGSKVGIWDAASGRLLRTLAGYSNAVSAVAFSPDGTQIASGGTDGMVRLWDASTGDELGQPISHPGVNWLAFSPDGRKILTTSQETARAWDVQTRRVLTELARPEKDLAVRRPVPVIVFQEDAAQPDTQPAASGTRYGRTVTMLETPARVWAALRGDAIVLLPEGGRSAAFSPDGRWMLTGGGAEPVIAIMREVDSGREVMRFKGHADRVLSVAFSPDGRRVVTGSADGTAKLWDAASGDELLTLKGRKPGVCYVAFSPDGSRLATGSDDGVFTVWESADPED